ncbi:MAG: sodium:solute symporter family protein [Candidatus Sumerlaeaceae bacterium]|nr:sodium:solute symporter family protein [Candidatus Sumerlaeaceae bacterium]
MVQPDIRILTIATLVYLLITLYLGLRAYRGSRTATDFLLAGRKTHPIIMALSYGSTFISTSAIVGFGGAAAVFGLSLLWLPFLNILLGIVVAFLVFGKRTRALSHELNAHTFPELLGRRYQSRFIHAYAAALIFLFMPLYAAAVLIGGARFIEQSFQISFEVAVAIFSLVVAAYVIAGGLKGVMYTDAFQGGIMLIGMGILLIRVYAGLGGILPAHQALNDLALYIPEKFKNGGIVNWTAMPVFGSKMWYQVMTTIVLGVGIGVLAQPQLAVRFMTVKSNRELNRGVGAGSFFIFMTAGVAYIVGALSNVYFMKSMGKVALAAAPNNNIDAIIPYFITNFMPSWFVVVFLLTLLSAAMSTMSSQFHTMGTAIGRDLCEQTLALSEVGHHRTVLLTRLGIIASIIITVILAYKLPGSIIAQATAVFFGLCGATFLPAYIGAIFWPRMGRHAALASMLAGSLVALFWLVFVQEKSATGLGLCRTFIGRDTLLDLPWSGLDAQIIALPIAAFTAIVVTLLTAPPSKIR